jgi:hypothetical protein
MHDVYWANDTTDALLSMCAKHITNWGGYDSPATNIFTSVSSAWRRNLVAYYSPMIKANDWTTALGYGGDQGELIDMSIPISRTLVRQYVSILVKQRLNFECDADTVDGNALQIARVGKYLANYYITEEDLENKIFRAAEQTAVLGAGYITCTWRTDKGYLRNVDMNGNAMLAGQNSFETPDITEVIYDWSVKFEDSPWCIIKQRRNRWDVLSQFPEMRDEILGAPTVYNSRRFLTDLDFIPMYHDTDLIYVYEFYHKCTASMPNGRMSLFLEGQKSIYDDKNLYKNVPAVQFMFEEMMSTGLGYPMLSSLLPSQEMYDFSMSSQATNLGSFAVQSILSPKGSDISAHQIDGLNFISYMPQSIDGGGKPEPLQLTKSPPEIAEFRNTLERLMESNSNLNAAVRGNPPPGVTAGTAIATLSANAQEFLTAGSKSIIIGIQKLMKIALYNDQIFATMEHLQAIVGPTNAYLLKGLKDKEAIKRVKIRESNPLLNSTAGRMQIADMVLRGGYAKNAQELFSILEGAPAESLYNVELDENQAVRSEIDAVLAGHPVTPAITDNHPLFVRALQAILYQAEIRQNSALVQQVTAIVQERIRLEMACPPELKAMLRGIPMPPQAPPQGGPQQQGGIPAPEPQNQASQPAQPGLAPQSV